MNSFSLDEQIVAGGIFGSTDAGGSSGSAGSGRGCRFSPGCRFSCEAGACAGSCSADAGSGAGACSDGRGGGGAGSNCRGAGASGADADCVFVSVILLSETLLVLFFCGLPVLSKRFFRKSTPFIKLSVLATLKLLEVNKILILSVFFFKYSEKGIPSDSIIFS